MYSAKEEVSFTENLEFFARQVVEGFLTGLHKSPYHGFSVEFAEHRLYNHGDSVKNIDWKLFGRSDKLFVKKFEDEPFEYDYSNRVYNKGDIIIFESKNSIKIFRITS